MRTSRRIVMASLLALSACKLPTPAPDAQAFARTVFGQIQAGDWAALRAAMPPELAAQSPDARLEPLRAVAPPGEPTAVRLRGFHVSIANGVERIALDQVYEFEEGEVAFHTELKRLGPSRFELLGFNIRGANEGPKPPPPPMPRRPEPKSDLKTI